MTLGRISLSQSILPQGNHLWQLSDLPRVVEANCGKSKPVTACLNISLEEEARVSSPSKSGYDKGKEVMVWESKVLVGTYARAPLVFESGRKCKLYDVDGKEYLDLSSGIAVNSLGHGDPDWVGAVVEQSTNEAAIKFARKFQRHSHPDAKKPATDFISFSNSFHGRTMGALALTSKEHYRIPFEPVMPGVTFVEYGNIEATRKEIIRGKTAAVFVEPLQGEGGIYSATKEFLQFLHSACDDAGALLVFDEVQCGLGRTGLLWVHETYGVFPDIMTLAKPLAGGLPIGAVLIAERVASAIGSGDHGSTFAGAPLVCHAALAVLEKISNPSFLASVRKKGDYFKQKLIQKLRSNSHVKEVRGRGLILGIELGMPASPLVDDCQDKGLLVLTAGKGNVVRLVPPLIISEQELDLAAETLSDALPVLDESSSV